jgi:hypothetical protein
MSLSVTWKSFRQSLVLSRRGHVEFSALQSELSDIWKKISSEWDQHLDTCFRVSRGFNPPRFEPGPSELEFSAQPTELNDIWKIFLRYETNTWTLASEPAEDWTHRSLNLDHLNTSSAFYQLSSVTYDKKFSSVWDQHLAACFRACRGLNHQGLNPDQLNSSSALYNLS